MQNMNLFETPQNLLNFKIAGTRYSVDLDNVEARLNCVKQINENTGKKYKWFKEWTGNLNWVIYDSDMYEELYDNKNYFLHYKEECSLQPIIPINASSCYGMFSGLRMISKLDFSNLSTGAIITMDKMFAHSRGLEHLDLSNFITLNLRNMNYMFRGCTNLMSIDFGMFNTSEVDLMEGVFFECKNLMQLDLSGFSTENVTTLKKFVAGCTSLDYIKMDGFNLSRLLDITRMFEGCKNLRTIDMPDLEAPRLMYGKLGVFYECRSLPNFNTNCINCDMLKSVDKGGYLYPPVINTDLLSLIAWE